MLDAAVLGVVGAMIAAFLFWVIRFVYRGRRFSHVFGAIGMLILAGFAGILLENAYPQPFALLSPYELVGTRQTTDLDGNECEVLVYAKPLSHTTPPGDLPRIKLVASSRQGNCSLTYDTGWRFWGGTIRAVPGGIELFEGEKHGMHGFRFQIQSGRWFLAKTGLLADTSLWEDRIKGAIHVGMSRDSLRETLRRWVEKPLPDEELTIGNPPGTQHSLDRDAALYVHYTPAGTVLDFELAERQRGRFEELTSHFGADLFPLAQRIHRSPGFRDADPVALLQAVNALRAAGPEQAATAIRAYHDVTHEFAHYPEQSRYDLDEERLFLILRLLFVAEDPAWPLPEIRLAWIRKRPPELKNWPLFPLNLENDLPLMIWPVILAGGEWRSPMDDLEYGLQHCRFPETPLEPRVVPWEAVNAILDSPAWRGMFPESEKEWQQTFLRIQAIKASPPRSNIDPSDCRTDAGWARYCAEQTTTGVHWDEMQQEFVPED